MEEALVALCIAPLVFIAEPLVYFVVDLVGLVMGLGWRHYSRKRKAAKAAKRSGNAK